MEGTILPDNLNTLLENWNSNIFLNGGRIEALKIIKRLQESDYYSENRDIPSVRGTSTLSAHLKFGSISIRELFWTLTGKHGNTHPMLKQLYWRDFFTHIVYNYPHVFGNPFYEKYSKIEWENDPDKFASWCSGETGFPIVDAGIRQLNQTGWMHNRVRMIVASFLVKDLFIDWRLGERYFAQKLIDYDPSVNNGNWQWVASTGCDAQPFFRIFNPWRQQKKIDQDCVYIKKWIPELRDFSSREIHDLYKSGRNSQKYINTIVDHKIASDKAKKNYSVFNSLR